MPTQVQFRRGTTAQNNNFTGASGEISINTSNNTIRVHDGSTVGGFELAKTGNLSSLASSTSAQLASLISDETGSGALVFATSPTLVTPILGTPQSATLTNATGLPISTGVSGLGSNQTTLLATNAQTGVTANTYGGSSKVPVFTVDTYGRITSAANVNVAGVSTFTASGNTFTIGTADGNTFSASIQPDSVTLGRDTTGDYVASMTAGNGITVGTATGEGSTPVITNTGVLSVNGQTGNATGFATTANSLSQFASTTSSQLATLISDETGTGNVVFSTSPVLTTPNLGTPSAAVLTSATGLPVSTGISGLGTGIATALAVNTGSAGAPVLFNGALGTPTSGTLTNATGLPLSSGVTGTLPVANGGTGVTASTGTGSVVLSASPTFTGNILADNLTLSGNLIVSGTTTTINSTTLTVDDKNIELGSTASPSDATADGGGITLKGDTDKTFNYVNATAAWTSNQDLNLLTGKVYEINGTSVLSSTTLGSGVTGSSLTSVGTISSGTWQGSEISTTYTAAKVTSVNGQTGAATGFATTANSLAQFASTTSSQLLGVISDETGSGALVFATSPTLVTPALGTPSAIVLTSGTGLPLSTGVTGTLPVANGGTGTASPATVAGTGISVSGSFPNQTITNTGVTSAVASTGISVSGATGAVTFTNTGVTSLVAGTNISVSGATGAVTVGVTGTVASATSATNSTNFAVTDDTTTNSTHYLTFVSGTSSNQAGKVSSTKITFNPSTGLLTSTDYNSSSDKRLKKNIKTVENALDKVMALRGVAFDWKEGGAKSIGLVAQEAEVILPEIVTHDDNGYMGIKYTNLIGVLVEAIKEQQVQINTLKKQIEKL
jgi:hypothetical protein